MSGIGKMIGGRKDESIQIYSGCDVCGAGGFFSGLFGAEREHSVFCGAVGGGEHGFGRIGGGQQAGVNGKGQPGILFCGVRQCAGRKSLSGKCGENAFYALSDDDVLTISGSGDMYDYGSEEGKFTPWHKEYYKSVVIENGITRIGDYAFYHGDVQEITIPDSVTAVGKYAFAQWSQTETISLPDSVETIEEGAFSGSTFHTLRIPEKVKAIPAKMMEACRELTEIALPEGVETIGDNSFESCESLSKVTLPETLTEIGAYCFGSCWAVTEVTIPASVTTIGRDAFFVWEDGQTIYVKGKTEAPSGWHDDWRSDEVKVVWNV